VDGVGWGAYNRSRSTAGFGQLYTYATTFTRPPLSPPHTLTPTIGWRRRIGVGIEFIKCEQAPSPSGFEVTCLFKWSIVGTRIKLLTVIAEGCWAKKAQLWEYAGLSLPNNVRGMG